MKNLFLLLLLSLLYAGAARAEVEGLTVEEFLQKLSTVPDVIKRRDPFVPIPAPFKPILTAENPVEDIHSLPLLERYPIDQYKVLAVLIGDVYPRALLRLPAEEGGKVVIIKNHDRLGNLAGVVSRITSEGLFVSQKVRDMKGKIGSVETLMKVSGKEKPETEPVNASPAARAGIASPPVNMPFNMLKTSEDMRSGAQPTVP